jgi:hypothetical protein
VNVAPSSCRPTFGLRSLLRFTKLPRHCGRESAARRGHELRNRRHTDLGEMDQRVQCQGCSEQSPVPWSTSLLEGEWRQDRQSRMGGSVAPVDALAGVPGDRLATLAGTLASQDLPVDELAAATALLRQRGDFPTGRGGAGLPVEVRLIDTDLGQVALGRPKSCCW